MKYVIYLCDIESDGLDPYKNNIIELSLIRLSDDVQKTWCIKPINTDNIQPDALRINGHKLDDILHKTVYGRETYKEANKAIVDIENWIAEDGVPAEQRIFTAHNAHFDKGMMEQLWEKCNSKETFPFGRRMLDSQIIEFFMDLCKGEMAEGYSLKNLVKKYGVTNDKAHTAASDTLALKQVFEKQVEFFKKVLK